jgi:ribosome-associated protein
MSGRDEGLRGSRKEAKALPDAMPGPSGDTEDDAGADASREAHEALPLDADTLALAGAFLNVLKDLKAGDLKALDVRGLTVVTDVFILATATGDRHLRAMAHAIEAASKTKGRKRGAPEGDEASGWVLVDAGDVVVHAMTEKARRYYDLEGLWADAAVLDVDRLSCESSAGRR